nr:hypothetical protein [Tanacetum cinerariifolium]
MSGGPSKKPAKPTVETAASATPAGMVRERPAALYTSGTTDDTPSPTSIKPREAISKVGNATANVSPTVVSTPLSCKVRARPNLSVNQSAMKRPVAIMAIKAEKPRPTCAFSASTIFLKYTPLQSNMVPSDSNEQKASIPRSIRLLSGSTKSGWSAGLG